MEFNRFILGKNVDVLSTFPDNCIDLVVTSPPYDMLRNYKGKIKSNDYNGYSFPFEPLANQLFRVLKDGGVIAWVVNDGDRKSTRLNSSHSYG
jgi:site-specific DNA-methyltransferase (adenine-specific)